MSLDKICAVLTALKQLCKPDKVLERHCSQAAATSTLESMVKTALEDAGDVPQQAECWLNKQAEGPGFRSSEPQRKSDVTVDTCTLALGRWTQENS